MKWRGWKNVPARKPLAVYSVVFASAIIVRHVWIGIDVPQNISGLLQMIVTVCVGSYAGSSAWESTRRYDNTNCSSWEGQQGYANEDDLRQGL